MPHAQSLGAPETVKFVVRHNMLFDLRRKFNRGRAMSNLGSENGENGIFDQVWHSGAKSGLSVSATNLTISDTLKDTCSSPGPTSTNYCKSPALTLDFAPHSTPRQKKEDVRQITENSPLSLELGQGCAKQGRTRSRAGQDT